MICGACGCDQGTGAQFCRRCGAQVTARAEAARAGAGPASGVAAGFAPTAFAPGWALPRQRVEQHRQALGIVWVLYGSFRLLALVFGALAFHSVAAAGLLAEVPPVAAALMRELLPVVVLLVAGLSVLDVAAGAALLAGKPWGRMAAIVAGCLSLLKVPFGTALGAYTLWVLAPRDSAEEWAELTGRA